MWSVEWLKWLEVEVEVEVVGSKALGGYDYDVDAIVCWVTFMPNLKCLDMT